MHARDHILRALVEPSSSPSPTPSPSAGLVGRLGTALGILSSILALDGAILYSPSEVRLFYRHTPGPTDASTSTSTSTSSAELVGASLDVYLLERDPVKYEGFLDLLSGQGARALGLEGVGLGVLAAQASGNNGGNSTRTLGTSSLPGPWKPGKGAHLHPPV